MYIDPVLLNWILIIGCSFCAGMAGWSYGQKKTEDNIVDGLLYLIQNGFIRHKTNSDGELEIMKLNEK